MTLFDDTVVRAKKEFPDLQIKFKNESIFMKILGMILFFNPAFMSTYITTIGNTMYFPSNEYVTKSSTAASIVLLHELVHVFDSKKENKLLFSILYLMPQILVLFFFPLLFLIGWKIALLSLVFLAPIPAYFRMKPERRAYTISLYAIHKFGEKGHKVNIDTGKNEIINQFKTGSYYFMWPFQSINTYFDEVVKQLELGNRPYDEPEVYDLIDRVIG